MSASNRFYRYFLNPVMRSLLRSPLHGVTSHNIGIVYFSGRKSGRKLSTPLGYTQEGNIVRLLSSRNTQWWLNFRGDGAAVEMEIARQRYPGTAVMDCPVFSRDNIGRGMSEFSTNLIVATSAGVPR